MIKISLYFLFLKLNFFLFKIFDVFDVNSVKKGVLLLWVVYVL